MKRVKSEREKMFSGELYNALDEELSIARMHARLLCKAFNDTRADERDKLPLTKILVICVGNISMMMSPAKAIMPTPFREYFRV